MLSVHVGVFLRLCLFLCLISLIFFPKCKPGRKNHSFFVGGEWGWGKDVLVGGMAYGGLGNSFNSHTRGVVLLKRCGFKIFLQDQ